MVKIVSAVLLFSGVFWLQPQTTPLKTKSKEEAATKKDHYPFILNTFRKNMIQSMTGFGKATLQLPTKKITVEVKS
jgi:hypothetical protein